MGENIPRRLATLNIDTYRTQKGFASEKTVIEYVRDTQFSTSIISAGFNTKIYLEVTI